MSLRTADASWREELKQALDREVFEPMEAAGERCSRRLRFERSSDGVAIYCVPGEASVAIRVGGTADRRATVRILSDTFGRQRKDASKAMDEGKVWEIDTSLMQDVIARLVAVGTEVEVLADFDEREVAGGVHAPVPEDSWELIYERRLTDDEDHLIEANGEHRDGDREGVSP